MAGIKSLAIRGVRSFGPEECDEQRISFEKPLTLILGQNGCGKTTVIECLRYAITGQMPPGSRNECFVHDVKVNRSTEVLGQVKLKLVNAKDKQLEVCRSMKVTALQKKKTKFQTLDSFLSVCDVNGEVKDISSRCADLDFVMQEELGVSRAILNSVIFCHQEDSSWPLDEGKKVKERFDEIFDADKYSDCFDKLKKLRKQYSQNFKILEHEVAYLSEKKQELDKKKLEMVDVESKVAEAEIKVAEISQELNPTREKIKAIETLQKNLVSFETKREKLKVRLEHNQKQEEELKKAITNLFEGTQEELQQNITNYASSSKSKQKELDESYKKNFSFNKEEEKIANEKTSNEVKVNKLILLESQNQERIDKKGKMIVETSKLAEIEVSEINSEEEADKAIEAITEKIKLLNKELEEMKSASDAEEKSLQTLVDESRDALSRHKQKISTKESDIQSAKKDIRKVEKEITDANESKVKLELVEKRLQAAEEDFEKVSNELNPEEAQKEIDSDEKLLEQYDNELEELNEKITKLQKQNTKIKERDMIEELLKQKESQMSVLRNKHRSSLVLLLGDMPESDFAITINKMECDLRTNVDSMKQKLKEKQMEITRLESDRKHIRESLKDKRDELTKAEDQMYVACGGQPYEATISKYTSAVEKLQDEQNVLQSSMFIFAKYKGQLKENNCCPLCNRGFDSEADVTDLISQLTTQVMNVPSKLEKVTEELQRSKAKKDELLGLKSLNEKFTTLKEKDIPELEKRLADVDEKISELTQNIDQLTSDLVEPEQKLQKAKHLQGDMPLLDRYSHEIKNNTKQLETLNLQCANLETGMSLDEATAKKTETRKQIVELRAKIKKSQSTLNSYTKRLQTVTDKKNKLKEEVLNIQKKVQEIVKLQEQVQQLEANRDKYTEELKELQESMEPLTASLKEAENNKSEAVKKNRSLVEIKRTHITKVTSSFDKIKQVLAEIKQHQERNIQREMDKIKEANDKLMEKQKQIMLDRDELTKKIDLLKDELSKQEIYKRDLEDNLKLRKAQSEIANCEKEIVELNEKISGVSVETISEMDTLIDKQNSLIRERSRTEGLLSEKKDRLKQLKSEIKKMQNRDVEKEYKEKYYELCVTKAIDKDIRDYSVALEKCLMEFHKEKMENINLIIREMWRKIYRGNDIDYIEIKTESSMTIESERRKYDYRVVQCKNGVEIDMRGRCSAGQKVLACLIIRLALAETFSSRFGILALDEPTTNLDQENISSLCSALAEIVQERMCQRNFMFIIITHDREFIDTLGSIDKVTHYYEVSRNDEGKSRIKKIKFA